MIRRSFLRARLGLAMAVMATCLAGTATAATSESNQQQVLPPPLQFVSNLDLECFPTEPYAPPPMPLVLSHLNPVLREAGLERWETELGEREQLCVPVAKNDAFPPDEVLRFIQYVDLSCYRIEGPSADFQLVLSHLNPLLVDLPRREVVMFEPEQLCVPVMKNDAVPPDEVLRLVQFIDIVCYRTERAEPLNIPLTLTQLNPVLKEIPRTEVHVLENRQLCVPVNKNDQRIPDEVLNIVQWIDLEKYDMEAPGGHGFQLVLSHLNPLLADLPREEAQLLERPQLALPVAKNGQIPPRG